MKTLQLIICISVASVYSFMTLAQDEAPEINSTFEISTGYSFSSSADQMYDHMNDNGFGEKVTQCAIFFCWNNNYPFKKQLSSPWQFAYSHYLTPKSRVGLIYNTGNKSEVKGATGRQPNTRYIDITFKSSSLIPFYSYQLDPKLNLQLGPALMFNKCESNRDSKVYQEISPGLLTGIQYRAFNTRFFYGKVTVQFILMLPTEVGPFSVSAHNLEDVVLPVKKINYSQSLSLFTMVFPLPNLKKPSSKDLQNQQ